MRKSVGGMLGAIVLIAGLSLVFAVNVASRYAPPAKEPRATGPKDACSSDADCWCASFDGAEFIPGVFVKSACEEGGTCALCLYE
jgi:hypothetical protein